MGKSWSEHFNYSIKTTSDTLHIPIPVPDSVAGSFAATMATCKGLIGAMRVASTSAKQAIYLRDVIAAARSAGSWSIRAAGIDEVLSVAGGVTAAAYIGALTGAALYATQQVLIGDWMDRVFDDFMEAQENAKAAAREAARAGAAPLACGQALKPIDFVSDAVFKAPANSCSAADNSPTYSSGWPTAPACF